MARTYVDFDLLIQRSGGAYRSLVIDSPAGNAAEDFTLPFPPLELENFLLRIGRSLGESRRDVRRLETSQRGQIREFGTRLFEAVFAHSVLSTLRASIDKASAKDAGVRIRLRLSDVPELANVPWEYLYNPTTNQFLCLTIDTPIVRYVDLPYGARPLTVTPPLRILVMVSSPKDLPPLDVDKEVARLQGTDALGELIGNGQVAIHVLERATLSALTRPLRTGEYHIFHFIGHGGFDESAQDGALLLEDDEKNPRLVTGQDLGVMLNGHRSLRLAVLNACEGARAATDDPFAGVATSLLQQGVPAAIAMQFEITDQAAITFAHEFYGALADGYPIDAAVTESRRAIFAASNELEWATPVLYLRAPTGRIFRVNPKRPPAADGGTTDREDDQHAAAERDRAEREEAERRADEEWAEAERAREERARAERERAALARAEREKAERLEAQERARLEREAVDRARLQREADEREAERLAALRRRRQRTVTGLVAVVLVVAVAAVVLILRPDPVPDTSGDIPAHSLFAMGAEEYELGDVIPLGDDVVGIDMRARDGDIWVAGDAAVVRVDGASGEIRATIPIEGPLSDFAFNDANAEDEVWVVHAGVLSEIDSSTNELLDHTLDATPEKVVVGESVWVLAQSDGVGDPDVVLKLSLSGEFIDEIAVDGVDIGVSDAGVWVADRTNEEVVKIDAEVEPLEEITRIEVVDPPDGIVASREFVYVFNGDRGTITAIEQSLEPRASVPIGHTPTSIRPGLGFAWTVNDDGTATRFDPNTGTAETIPLPEPVSTMAVDNDQRLIWAIAAAS